MFNDIPAWVTAYVPIIILVIIVVIAMLVFVVIAAPFAGRVIANIVVSSFVSVRRRELDELSLQVKTAEDILGAAKAITQTASEFVADESLPLKQRQALSALRSAQLQHQYDSLLKGLVATQTELLTARKRQASAQGLYAGLYAEDAARLTAMIAEQQAQVAKLEPLLDEWGVQYTRITRLQSA